MPPVDLRRREEALAVLQNKKLLGTFFDRLLEVITLIEAAIATTAGVAASLVEVEPLAQTRAGATEQGTVLQATIIAPSADAATLITAGVTSRTRTASLSSRRGHLDGGGC